MEKINTVSALNKDTGSTPLTFNSIIDIEACKHIAITVKKIHGRYVIFIQKFISSQNRRMHKHET